MCLRGVQGSLITFLFTCIYRYKIYFLVHEAKLHTVIIYWEEVLRHSPSLCLVQTWGMISMYFCICLWRPFSLAPRLCRVLTKALSSSMSDTRHHPVSISETMRTNRHVSQKTLNIHHCKKVLCSALLYPNGIAYSRAERSLIQLYWIIQASEIFSGRWNLFN